ncbi:transposase family protein [Vibrio chagasii]|nr:transposase family protein [Vibrio chagasii]
MFLLNFPFKHEELRRVCGIKTESPFLVRALYASYNEALKSYIEQLLPLLPIKHISQLTSVHWHTIKEIDKRRLRRVVPSQNGRG